jgi:DNA-binding beta-propeller fold protein YncE
MKVTRTIPMPRSGPVGGIAFNHRGTTAYVTGLGGLTAVNVANAHTRWFSGATRLFPGTGDINTGPVVAGPHRTLLVVNSTFPDSPQRGTLTTLARSGGKVLGRTTLGNEPTSMALDPMGHQVLVTNYADGTVSHVTTRR